jgi:hypothetical protein
MMMEETIPRNIVWSTDRLDLTDPFQRKWYLRQVLTYGREENIQKLDFDEIETYLEELNLPADVLSLWKRYMEERNAFR